MPAESFYRPPPRLAKRLSADLRGFGPAGLFALITILLIPSVRIHHVAIPAGGLLVLVWARLSHTPWQQIGYRRPRSWMAAIGSGVIFGCALKLFTKAVAMPLLGAGPVNQAYHYLAGNTELLPYAVWAMLVAGFSEETVYRGFLFERLEKLMGRQWWSQVIIIILTSLWFGLGHYAVQGWAGAVNAVIVGLVFGAVYSHNRSLPVLMIAHAAYDLTALTLIYFELETSVAGFFFH